MKFYCPICGEEAQFLSQKKAATLWECERDGRFAVNFWGQTNTSLHRIAWQRRCTSNLTELQYQLCELYYDQHKGISEIAKEMGKSYGSVRNSLQIGNNKMLVELDFESLDLSEVM